MGESVTETPPVKKSVTEAPLVNESVTETPLKTARSRSVPQKVPAKTRRFVFTRAGFRCQELNRDGTRCESRHFLEIEHIRPRAKGGSHDLTNLELLCRDHNQIRGIRSFGIRQMQRQ